jgi:hypothetical protein
VAQKTFIIDTAVKTSQKAVFFDLTYFPSKKEIKCDSTVTGLWNPITLRNPEFGGDTSSEASVINRGTRYTVPGDTYILGK